MMVGTDYAWLFVCHNTYFNSILEGEVILFLYYGTFSAYFFLLIFQSLAVYDSMKKGLVYPDK